MRARITRTVSKFPDGHFLQWTIDGANESGTYVAKVFRAGGPDGPWELIAEGLSNTYAYFDRFELSATTTGSLYVRPNQLQLFRNFHYKVEIITPLLQRLEAQEELGPLLQNRKLEGVRRKLVRDLKIQQRKLNGTLAALLKRRVWGEVCTKCTDRATGEQTRAACKICWGTKFVGGYWTPTLVYARRLSTEGASSITPAGKSDAEEVKIWAPDVPAMERDDVIVFFEDQQRYRIDHQTQTEMKTVAVHQVFVAQRFEHSNIIYRLAVDPRSLSPLF